MAASKDKQMLALMADRLHREGLVEEAIRRNMVFQYASDGPWYYRRWRGVHGPFWSAREAWEEMARTVGRQHVVSWWRR